MPENALEDLDWESRCKRCCLCCFEKIEDERGNIFYTQTPCRYLDVVGRHCAIYDRRFVINPVCIKLTPQLLSTLRWLPSDCGYRESIDEPKRKSGGNSKTRTPRKRG